jgi:hypothetical protein
VLVPVILTWNSPNFPDSSFRCLGLRIAAQTRRG